MDNTLIIPIIAIICGFFVQTIIGFASGLIAIPILLLAFDYKESVAFLAIFLLLFSFYLFPKNFKDMDKKVVIEMGIGTLIGISIGIFALQHSNPIILKKLLGIFTIVYVIYSHFSKTKIEILKKLGFYFGLSGGFFSGLFSSGGTVYVTYIYNKLESAKVVRATIIGVLAISNLARIPLLIGTKILTFDIFIKALPTIPFFFASVFLASKIVKKIPEKPFVIIIEIVLSLTGVSLILL